MSNVVPHNKINHRSHNERAFLSEPVVVDYGAGHQRPEVYLAGGKHGAGTCVGCVSPPCIKLDGVDLKMPNELSMFPGDPDLRVCPTDAIRVVSGVTPYVSAEQCIGCGLCVSRCPFGAVSLQPSGLAVVHVTDPDSLTIPGKDMPAPSTPARKGFIGAIGASYLQALPENIAKLSESEGSLLVRNLFIQIGIACRTRRKGDQNMRIDAVGLLENGRIAVIEIELTGAVLESPRALLEDIAVLHGRYRVDITAIDPVSVIVSLPNVRSEYYKVIDDIGKILELRCRTITTGALLSLMWGFFKVNGFVEDLFSTSASSADLRGPVIKLISKNFPPDEPYIGALSAAK